MKILNEAFQKSFVVRSYFYSGKELNDMVKAGILFPIKMEFDEDIVEYRIMASICKEINIVYNEKFGMYLNVAVTNCGIIIIIEL